MCFHHTMSHVLEWGLWVEEAKTWSQMDKCPFVEQSDAIFKLLKTLHLHL